ncbi:hypothetical protein KNE206_53760 [Kitasatospora sp. NE20-6]|uniref:GNAT family N-acetyltransferase n=1 Tax=Kitasatospora sp. NE20-6 TaxID=2859066 RepID=UPI0034DBEAED
MLGSWLHPGATSRGLVSCAVQALAGQAFLLPGVDCVEIVHAPADRGSGAVPARLGFVEHRRRPAERLAPTETGEERVWQLTRDQAKSLPQGREDCGRCA